MGIEWALRLAEFVVNIVREGLSFPSASKTHWDIRFAEEKVLAAPRANETAKSVVIQEVNSVAR